MTQNLPPPIPSLIPETAPFSEEQRAWLNGFFAGLVSLDGFGVTPLSSEQAADLIGGASAKSKDDDDGEAPWHDQTLPLSDRMQLAEGRPLWVYFLRPPMTLAIRIAAALYGLQDRWDEHVRPALKHSKRAVWRALYESSQRLGHTWRRSKKRLIRAARGARRRGGPKRQEARAALEAALGRQRGEPA